MPMGMLLELCRRESLQIELCMHEIDVMLWDGLGICRFASFAISLSLICLSVEARAMTL
jgi:hypothetical protein